MIAFQNETDKVRNVAILDVSDNTSITFLAFSIYMKPFFLVVQSTGGCFGTGPGRLKVDNAISTLPVKNMAASKT